MSKVIVVTGTSRGIGKSIVENILKLEPNAHVIGIARTSEDLEKLKIKYGEHFSYVHGDITDEANQDKLLKLALKGHNKIDSIIANAGVLAPVANVSHFNAKEWKSHFDVNFFSIVSLTSKALPWIEKANGSIIFVSSGASVKPYYGWSCYCAAKAAINSYAMSIASEDKEVRTIAVAPGVVDTQMQVDIRDKFGPKGMTPDSLKRFTDLKDDNQLLPPEVPALVYSRLAVYGIPEELNGQYIRYNDQRLK